MFIVAEDTGSVDITYYNLLLKLKKEKYAVIEFNRLFMGFYTATIRVILFQYHFGLAYRMYFVSIKKTGDLLLFFKVIGYWKTLCQI